MKINKKALELIENGLSSKTVSKLTESQINILHKKLVNEQINVSKTDTATISKLKSEKKPFQVYEKELDEEEEVTVDPNKEVETQDPKQVGPSSDDGFGNEDDGMGMFESEADLKPRQPNPWAICHAQVGPKKTRKFERCVQSVKKQLAEGKNPLSLFLENEITKLVEKHVPAKMTKGELLKYLSEGNGGTKTAPVRTKPDVKPATKPGHPMKNPHPGEKPSPKAKSKTTMDEAQPETAPTIAPTRTKPDVRPRPSHPMKNPHPGEKPSPKAKKISPEVAKDKVIDTIMNILKK
jgi:hypothetical protein